MMEGRTLISGVGVRQGDDTARRALAHGLSPYRAPDQRDALATEWTAQAGGAVHTIGHSVEGRPILAMEVPSRSQDAPSVLVCANIHGVEFIAAEVALGFLERLACGEQNVEALRERANIWVIPSLNPDAYARTWRDGGIGRLDQLRRNANGVDLNRNFPKPAQQKGVWFDLNGWRTGSDDPNNAFYRGHAPASEPETQALVGLHKRVELHASANLHSTMGTMIPPCVTSAADYRQYKALCRSFRGAQPRWRYRRLSNRWLDRFTGEQEDFQHHMGGTWALCIEHYAIWARPSRLWSRGPIFWRFNPEIPGPWVDNDIPGLLAFFDAALKLERPRRLQSPDSEEPSR